jgi:hypothetical protein
VGEFCSEPECAEAAALSLGERSVCRAHYLAHCYRRLETISAQVKSQHFNREEAEAAGRFLQDCMRSAADIASAPEMPSNLERAKVFDILLWASELHGRLRRSPRRLAKFSILLRSEIPGRSWEARAETQVVSRHGMRITCRAEILLRDTLTCIRLDNGRRAEVIVAWTTRSDSGEVEAGLEFTRDENFWGFSWGSP